MNVRRLLARLDRRFAGDDQQAATLFRVATVVAAVVTATVLIALNGTASPLLDGLPGLVGAVIRVSWMRRRRLRLRDR